MDKPEVATKEVRMKNWKAECPRCHHIEFSEDMGTECDNCGAPAIMTFGINQSGWTDNSARQSWRMLQCSNNCGWKANKVECSQCGTIIQGDWFKGNMKWCFVATVAFEDEDHPTVERLRKIRDLHLLNNSWGRGFVRFYYRTGPALAKTVNIIPFAKPATRFFLTFISKAWPK